MMITCEERLRKESAVYILPEETRSDDGKINPEPLSFITSCIHNFYLYIFEEIPYEKI